MKKDIIRQKKEKRRKSKKDKKMRNSKGVNNKRNEKEESTTLCIDDSSLVHHYLCMKELINFNPCFSDIYENIDKQITDDKKLVDSIYIKELMDKIEKIIKNKVEKYDVYEMVYWSRRIKPENMFNCTNHTIFSYRQLILLSFAKYCKKESTFVMTNGTSKPSCFSNLDGMRLLKFFLGNETPTEEENCIFNSVAERLNICYEVEVLAFYYIYLMQRYRVVCKGGKLINDFKMGIKCIIDVDTEDLINLYDKRLGGVNILSSVGGYTSLDFKLNNKLNIEPSIIVYQENLEKISTNELYERCIKKAHKDNDSRFSFLIEQSYQPNYFPHPISLTNYYTYAKMFSEEFIEYYGFTIEEIIVFVQSICYRNMESIMSEPHNMNFMLNRGYTMYNYSELKESYIENNEFFCKALNFPVVKDLEATFSKIFEFLEYNKQNSNEIKFSTLGPRKVFIKFSNDYGIIDYTAWLNVFECLLDPVCKNNDKKGKLFENIVSDLIINQFGKESIWIIQKKIKANNYKREIDVSFVYKDILFILECKAVNLSWGFFKGDTDAVNFRIMKNKKAIEQADKTLSFIYENIGNTSVPLPQNIKYIASLVISPHPEYIWEKDENLFVDTDIPRILSINEIDKVINENFLKSIKNKKFCKQIN